MSVRHHLLEWLVTVLVYGMAFAVGLAVMMYVNPIIGSLLSGIPPRWFPLDVVTKVGLFGGVLGGIAGTGVYLVVIMERRKHRIHIQEPKRPQRQWRLRWRPGSQRARVAVGLACLVATSLLVVGLLYLGDAFFNDKPLSLPKLDDLVHAGLLILVLAVAFGMMIWRIPPRK